MSDPMKPASESAPAGGAQTQERKQGPYGLVGPAGNPMCEECDIEMHAFAGHNGHGGIDEGFACAGCGWSIDTN